MATAPRQDGDNVEPADLGPTKAGGVDFASLVDPTACRSEVPLVLWIGLHCAYWLVVTAGLAAIAFYFGKAVYVRVCRIVAAGDHSCFETTGDAVKFGVLAGIGLFLLGMIAAGYVWCAAVEAINAKRRRQNISEAEERRMLIEYWATH